MYYTNLLNFTKNDRVLEIGPGSAPFWRANVLADKYTAEDEVPDGNFGGGTQQLRNKPFVKIVDNQLPFADKCFDWVICSHVLEHVPVGEITVLVNELKRVGKKIYIEFPCYLYELTHNIPAHVNVLSLDESRIFMIEKAKLFRFSHLELQTLQFFFSTLENQKHYKYMYTIGAVYSASDLSIHVIKDSEAFCKAYLQNTYRTPLPSFTHKVLNFLKGRLFNASMSESELQQMMK